MRATIRFDAPWAAGPSAEDWGMSLCGREKPLASLAPGFDGMPDIKIATYNAKEKSPGYGGSDGACESARNSEPLPDGRA